MKKSLLKSRLKDIAKFLTSDKAQNAIEILKAELDSYQEPKSVGESIDKFPIPKELERNSKAIALFSDGGCRGNPGPGAYGFLAQNSKGDIVFEQAEFFDHTTNNRMELQGAISALEFALESASEQEIFVYTDSKYVVDGINSWVSGWKSRGWKKADKKAPENLEYWQKLDELTLKTKAKFLWVKGHAGHPQNERADQLANECMDDHEG